MCARKAKANSRVSNPLCANAWPPAFATKWSPPAIVRRGKLEWKVDLLGSRPGGELAAESPLLAALRAADAIVENESRIERSSTDANIPLSMGIDAISIGAGGNGGGAHSLQEWYDPAGREMGLKRALLTLLGMADVAPEKTR